MIYHTEVQVNEQKTDFLWVVLVREKMEQKIWIIARKQLSIFGQQNKLTKK